MTKEAIEAFVAGYFKSKVLPDFSVVSGNNPGHEVRIGSGPTMKLVTLDGFDEKEDAEKLQNFLNGLTLE